MRSGQAGRHQQIGDLALTRHHGAVGYFKLATWALQIALIDRAPLGRVTWVAQGNALLTQSQEL